MNSKVEDGTWYVRPQEQLAAEREYLDRDLMVKAWTSVVKERRYLIAEAAAYCADAKSELLGSFPEMSYVNALVPPYSSNFPDEWLALQPGTLTLRFVGRVPGTILVAEGRETSVGELPANAREALDRWLLSGKESLGSSRDAEHPFGHVSHAEPTEALPRGIPSDTRIRIRWITAQFVMWQRIPDQPMMLAAAEDVFYMLQWNNQNAHYDSATGRALQVEVLFADGRLIKQVIRETPDYMSKDRNWRRLSELPNEVLEVMRAEARRQEELGNLVNTGRPPPTH